MWPFKKKGNLPKGSFAYGNEKEAEKSSDVSAFVIEAIIIGIVVVVILLVLNYFSIFPLYKMNPKLFGWLPVSKNLANFNIPGVKVGLNDPAQILTPTPTKLDKNAPPDIFAVSEINGYKISVKNKAKLIQLLTDWKVIGGNFTNKYGIKGTTIDYPVKRVTAILTDKVQGTNQFVQKDNSVYTSSMTIVKPQEMTIYVHILPSMLSDVKRDPGYLYDAQFLTTVYNLVRPIKKIGEAQPELNNILKDKFTNKINYFEIVKK